MVCIYCGGNTQVGNSRLQKKQNSVWRRRTCDECSATVTTLEKVDLSSAIIVTRGSHHEPFSRDKLMITIHDSCKHRKSALKDAIALTDTVITHLYPLITEASVPRDTIVTETTKILTRFDKAAAVQYAAFHPL